MRDITNNLTKEIVSQLMREHLENELHVFCRDVDYYMIRGMNEKESVRYVCYWYDQLNKKEVNK